MGTLIANISDFVKKKPLSEKVALSLAEILRAASCAIVWIPACSGMTGTRQQERPHGDPHRGRKTASPMSFPRKRESPGKERDDASPGGQSRLRLA
jgi:hypothetical protein